MPVEITDPPTTEEITDRAWLLGKLQTSLMRDSWGIVDIDPEAGTLNMADGQLTFTLSLSLPVRVKPAALPVKKTAAKRKR